MTPPLHPGPGGVTTSKERIRTRVTVGWYPGSHSVKERQAYAALADRVGHRLAPDYADSIINWKLGRPPDKQLSAWLHEYEDEKWPVDDRVRSRVEHKVDRFHKQEHVNFLRQMMKAGRKALEPVEATGDMPQPVILKYIADGVNQGMMLHSARSQQTEQLSLGGLTINVGNRPTPKKLRAKQVEQVIEGVFTEVPALASPRDDS